LQVRAVVDKGMLIAEHLIATAFGFEILYQWRSFRSGALAIENDRVTAAVRVAKFGDIASKILMRFAFRHGLLSDVKGHIHNRPNPIVRNFLGVQALSCILSAFQGRVPRGDTRSPQDGPTAVLILDPVRLKFYLLRSISGHFLPPNTHPDPGTGNNQLDAARRNRNTHLDAEGFRAPDPYAASAPFLSGLASFVTAPYRNCIVHNYPEVVNYYVAFKSALFSTPGYSCM
jgi:hypothetical protein